MSHRGPGLVLALLFAAVPARGERVRADATRSRAASVYAGQPDAAAKLRVEEIFGIYLVDPPRRHASERVELAPGQVTINYWQPAEGLTDAELFTRATGWCLLGRTQFSPGARAVFSEMGDVDEIVLVFHEVFRKDQKGRRLGEESVVPYLKARITRGRFGRLKLEPVQACVEKGDCTAIFRNAFDETRFDRKGIKLR